jgi:hypothetical protein
MAISWMVPKMEKEAGNIGKTAVIQQTANKCRTFLQQGQ